MLSGEKMEPEQALEYLNDEIDLSNFADLYEEIYSNMENKDIIQKAGYDGIVSEFGRDNGEVVKEYVAFTPDQITTNKSTRK